MGSSTDDLRLAAAALRREPRWTAAVTGVLALGVGAVTAAGTLARVTSVLPFRVASVLEPAGSGPGGWGLDWGAEAVLPAAIRAGHLDELFTALALAGILTFTAGCVAAWILVSARFRARRRELGVRAAVGAGRGRLGGQLVAEGLLLAAAGVGGGAAAGRAAGWWLLEHPPEGLAVAGSGGPGWIAAAALAAAGTVWISAGPVRRGAAARAGGFASPRRLLAVERRGAGDLLAGATAALCLPLLVGAGLAVASFAPEGSEGEVASGAKDSVLLRVRLSTSPSAPQERADRLVALLRRVRGAPGVTAGSLSTPGAWSGMGVSDRVLAECRCARGGMSVPFVGSRVRHAAVSPDFFRTLGLDVHQGGTFEEAVGAGPETGRAGGGSGGGDGPEPRADDPDGDAAPPVVVNRAYDRRTLRGARAVGKAIRVQGRVRDGTWHRVRGVVGDLAAGGLSVDRPVPTVYLPLGSHPPGEADLIVRGPGDPAELAESAREAAVAAAPGARVEVRGTLAQEAARLASPLDAVRRLFGPTAALALFVVMAGVAGATGDETRRRRSEMALRRAVGARRRDVAALVLRWAARVCVGGVVAGFVFAVPFAVSLHLLLPGVDVAHSGVWAAAVLTVLASGIAGAAGPAWRIARADPARALGLS